MYFPHFSVLHTPLTSDQSSNDTTKGWFCECTHFIKNELDFTALGETFTSSNTNFRKRYKALGRFKWMTLICKCFYECSSRSVGEFLPHGFDSTAAVVRWRGDFGESPGNKRPRDISVSKLINVYTTLIRLWNSLPLLDVVQRWKVTAGVSQSFFILLQVRLKKRRNRTKKNSGF